MASKKTATVILLDVSAATKTTQARDGLFIDEAKWIVARILLRKIFSTENDEVGVVLMGSEVTDCAMARQCKDSYENIQELCPLELASFNAIDAVMRLEPTKIDFVDWMAGIAAASDFLDKSCRGRRFRSKQMVILSPFVSELEYDTQSVTALIEGINSLNLTVVFIGTNILEDPLFEGEFMQLIRTALNLFKNAVNLSWNEARNEFKLYEKKTKMARFTKVNLKIGENIEIPMTHMKLNIDETRLKWTIKRPIIPQFGESVSNGTHSSGQVNPERPASVTSDVTVKQENVTGNSSDVAKPQFVIRYNMDDCKAAIYGATEVLLTYADIDALKLETGPPSLRYIASIRSSDITRAMLVGSDSYVFMPDSNPRSLALFSAFADTLLKENRYALVRRIASTNGNISIGALIPVRDELGKAMYFVKLPFSDFIQGVPQKPLPDEEDPKLKEIINNLVDTMTLNNIQGRETLFKDPNFQKRSDLVAKAALGTNAGKVTFTDDIVDELFNPFKELRFNAKPSVDELKRLYPIHVPVKKTKEQTKGETGTSTTSVEKLMEIAAQLPAKNDVSLNSTSNSQSIDCVMKDMQEYYKSLGEADSCEPSTEDLLKDF